MGFGGERGGFGAEEGKERKERLVGSGKEGRWEIFLVVEVKRVGTW